MFYQYIINPILKAITQYSQRNAFCIHETLYTYEQFGQYISQIRHALQNTQPLNDTIGLVINDDIETYSTIIALWLEGKSYVPLHPNWPVERCLDICNQVNLDLIIDSSKTSRYTSCAVIHSAELPTAPTDLTPTANVSDSRLAYILFTSGSTGKPKGVQITRRNLAAFMDSFWQTGIRITEEDRCLQCFDLTFDVSVQGYLVPLTRGACCYTIPNGQVKYIYAGGLINDHHLTFAAMAPSMLRYLKPYFDEFDASSLKTCILTAEACPLSLMEDWYNCATHTDIYDFYGPTECTIYCTYYKLTKGGKNKELNGIISIGKPLSRCTALILDNAGNELPTGEKGELCIAGDQVTPGYWNAPQKTSQALFIKEVEGKPMTFYHTGDLCYKDEKGDIMYSGRIDHQAKIQGFRVELGEIEYHARQYLQDKNVVCVAFDNKDGLTEIAMFIESTEFDTAQLMTYLNEKMPTYMIPTRILFAPTFPLNGNDKIDKNRLKQLL